MWLPPFSEKALAWAHSQIAEIFAAAMQTARRGTIVGTETCGCVLAIRNQHLLPDGGVLDVSELDYQTSQGVRLEENGIKPDETVLLRRKDLYSDRDPAMKLALEKLSIARSLPRSKAVVKRAVQQ